MRWWKVHCSQRGDILKGSEQFRQLWALGTQNRAPVLIRTKRWRFILCFPRTESLPVAWSSKNLAEIKDSRSRLTSAMGFQMQKNDAKIRKRHFYPRICCPVPFIEPSQSCPPMDVQFGDAISLMPRLQPPWMALREFCSHLTSFEANICSVRSQHNIIHHSRLWFPRETLSMQYPDHPEAKWWRRLEERKYLSSGEKRQVANLPPTILWVT